MKPEGKAGGIIITGNLDGAQHTIAHTSNYFTGIGIYLPPFATFLVCGKARKMGLKPPG